MSLRNHATVWHSASTVASRSSNFNGGLVDEGVVVQTGEPRPCEPGVFGLL